MIYTFKEIKKTLGSVYQVNLALDQGKYYKIEPGIYSNKKHSNYLEIIVKKYPKAIISGDSAYYYHNLTDTVPKYINVTTPRNSTRINNAEVRQSFTVDCYYCLGKTTIDYNGVEINIYDKERMLIELVKNKNNMSYDYYKEIINNYRNMKDNLDIFKIMEYADMFPNGAKYMTMIQDEVF